MTQGRFHTLRQKNGDAITWGAVIVKDLRQLIGPIAQVGEADLLHRAVGQHLLDRRGLRRLRRDPVADIDADIVAVRDRPREGLAEARIGRHSR